jgi:hypothetical protein
MKYTVVTTFNARGYETYGRRMINTFLSNWPSNVMLIVYAEGCIVTETAPNLIVRDLDQVPDLTEFKNKWRNVPKANGDVSQDPIRSKRRDAGKGFKWDAVRFAHKVYSIFDCAQNTNGDWLLWMDADMVCHSPITVERLDQLCTADLCFLGRQGKFSECGLYAMNLRSASTIAFLQEFQRFYDDAERGIFTLDEWHDSFVFDAVRQHTSCRERDWSSHLITGEGHPLINSEWGAYLDHLKGDRKHLGRSTNKDLKIKRSEIYWG